MLSREEKVALLRSRLGGTEAPRADALSPAQTRLWELENQLGASEMHVFALAYHLDGFLDVQQLAEAIAAVAERHPALHARVAFDDGRPFFEPVRPPSLMLRSFTCSKNNGGDAKLDAALRDEAAKPIDVRSGAGWRAVLFERSAESHTLLVQFHHIFADRWSVAVFMTDLATAFKNISAKRAPFDSALAPTEPAARDISPTQLAYWETRFAEPAATVELPSAHRLETFSNYAGSRIESVITPERVTVLQELAAAESTTMFPLLLAAFAATLHAHTGQEDLVVCTPMVGRHRAGSRGVIGYFNNIVPLRLDLSGNPSFRELVSRVSAEAREAAAHQDIPFHAIASLPQLASARITRCLFAVQKMPGLNLELPDLTVRYRDVPNGTANFDLALFLEEIDGRVDVLVDHKTSVLDTAAVTSLQNRFFEILDRVASQPGLQLSELPQFRTERHETTVSKPSGAGYRPRNLLEQRMVEIWRTVFPGAEINGNSHFFELGGDSMRAARLFTLIEKEFSHQLPLASLIEAPTPRHLTAKMRDADWMAPWLSLIPIKATGSRPPLFCVHGGGGGVLTFKFIGDCLSEDQPLYSLQARGLRRGETPHTTVEEMAEHYVESIRQLFPKGPYLLAGHSLGAAVALEMSQRLIAAGHRVAFLGLFDHPGPKLKLGWRDWIGYQMSYLSSLPPRERPGHVLRGIVEKARIPAITSRVSSSFRRVSGTPTAGNKPSTAAPPTAAPAPGSSRPDLFEHNLQALLNYEVKPFPGRVTLFRARHGSPR
ncbi:MAG: non-ribosomal peptide synthase, partial [Gemmatimonadetes bacterium]|nr:non-ribosomal peptide synthase [Gemmatimonadota bacterium]